MPLDSRTEMQKVMDEKEENIIKYGICLHWEPE
jgi:hypothetical protein